MEEEERRESRAGESEGSRSARQRLEPEGASGRSSHRSTDSVRVRLRPRRVVCCNSTSQLQAQHNTLVIPVFCSVSYSFSSQDFCFEKRIFLFIRFHQQRRKQQHFRKKNISVFTIENSGIFVILVFWFSLKTPKKICKVRHHHHLEK